MKLSAGVPVSELPDGTTSESIRDIALNHVENTMVFPFTDTSQQSGVCISKFNVGKANTDVECTDEFTVKCPNQNEASTCVALDIYFGYVNMTFWSASHVTGLHFY